MNRVFASIGLTGFLLLGACSVAHAAEDHNPAKYGVNARGCGKIEDVTKYLAGEWQETPAVRGMKGPEGTPFVIFTSPKGTFSIALLSPPNACVVTIGDAWQAIESKPAEQPGQGS